MDHDRSRRRLARIRRIFRSTILEVESLRKLEIQLDRCALEGALQSVFDRDVYLGTVERPVSRIHLPFPRVMVLERFRQLLLCEPQLWGVCVWGERMGMIAVESVIGRWSGAELKAGGGEKQTHSLSFIPSLDLTEIIFRSSGEFKRKFETE